MSEVYHEYMIKRNMTMTGRMLRIFIVLSCIASVVAGLYFPYTFLLSVALAYLTRYVWQMTDVEYEYLYLSGECQVDKICGKIKRKGCGKIEMDKVEIVAPEGAKELEAFEKQVYKLRDFSSLEKCDGRYIVFQRNNDALIKVIFEPNEDILKEMKMVAPRKVKINMDEQLYL